MYDNVVRGSNFIGKSNWHIDDYLNGVLDDLKIFDRGLNEDEIGMWVGSCDEDACDEKSDSCD